MFERTSKPARATLTALAAMFVAACSQPPVPPPPGPPEVVVTKPVRRPIVSNRVFTGSTAASAFVEIRARVPGYLEEMHFVPGQEVQVDDVLFTIEREAYEARHAQVLANLESAKAQLARADADLARVQEAVKTNAVSVQDVDQRKAERDVAAASVAETDAALRQSELDLSYCDVATPVTGQVSRNLVDIGNLVGSGENTMLATVAQMDPMFVYFQIDEKAVVRWLDYTRGQQAGNEGLPAFLAVEGDQGFPHEGVITYAENRVDTRTGTIEVRATFPNEEGLLYPGLFARIKVEGQEIPNALVVREEAIGTDLGGKYLLVVGEGDEVLLKHVELGVLDGEHRVVLSGLDENDRYIYEGQLRARPGFPCRPLERDPESGGESVQGEAPESNGSSGSNDTGDPDAPEAD